jgi:2-iminobutanoate/2-iminopropanoate deaminase
MRIVLLTLVVCSLLHAVERKAIFPTSAKPIGPFSPGVLAGDYLYVSGQGARDANGNLPAGVAAQTKQCLNNIKTIIEAAGLTMDHIVYTHIYLTDMRNYGPMNSAYATFFKDPLPARSTMGVTRMPLDTPVEISAIAFRDKTNGNRSPCLAQNPTYPSPLAFSHRTGSSFPASWAATPIAA